MRGFAAIGIQSPKVEANIGGVLRAAHCYEAAFVTITSPRYKHQPQDTSKAFRSIPLLLTNDLLNMAPFDCKVVGVEYIASAKPLNSFVHPERAFYIFGGEDRTLEQEILDRCDYVVYIPTKICMNLAATVNVVLYDRMAKQ